MTKLQLTPLQQTVKGFLDEIGDSVITRTFFNDDFDVNISTYDAEDEIAAKTTFADLNLKTDCVEQHGGEGEGEDYYTVYYFANDTDIIYVKFQGWYQSYNGSEFTKWFFVVPKQITQTIYV